MSVATDGAPSMYGKEIGFVGCLRKFLNEIGKSTVHIKPYIVRYIERRFMQSANINKVIDVVVKTVNFIKSHSLRHC